jgi:adenylate cyclase
LDSRSGTRLNDVPIQAAEVRSGDLVSVGPHVFRVDVIADDGWAPSVPVGTMAFDDPSAQLMLQEFCVSDFNLARQLGTINAQENLDRLRNHLEVVQEFARAIQTTLDTNPLIERTLDELFRVFSKMDAGVLFLRDATIGQLAPAAIRRRGTLDSGPVGYSTTILRSVEAEQKAVVLLDVSQDSRFQHAASVKLGSMRTHMCVPLVVPGEVVGAIYLVAEGKEGSAIGFDAEDLALLAALSGTVAVCVKNASLAREAQRNAQLNSNLQRYVSPEVTRRIIEQGVAGALSARTADGVAMFCDLVGFTALSEQLAPDRMARLLNRYFRRALDIVFKYDGSVNKFGGDSFLAVWGAIDSATTDLTNAVRAALEIQNDIFRLGAELANDGVDSIQLTIGLNRGRFFAGDIGSEERMEFTIIGDAVNVAARIQALAHGTQVLTTTDSLGAARAEMGLVVYPDTPIRGRATGVTVASVRSIMLAPPDESESSVRRMLVSIPVQVPQTGGRGVLIAAELGDQLELELLMDRAAMVGQPFHVALILAELAEPVAPIATTCLESVAEEHCHAVRLRVAKPADDLLQLLLPGSERVASRPLRQKV